MRRLPRQNEIVILPGEWEICVSYIPSQRVYGVRLLRRLYENSTSNISWKKKWIVIAREISNEIGREIVGQIGREIGREIGKEISGEIAKEIAREIAREIATFHFKSKP